MPKAPEAHKKSRMLRHAASRFVKCRLLCGPLSGAQLIQYGVALGADLLNKLGQLAHVLLVLTVEFDLVDFAFHRFNAKHGNRTLGLVSQQMQCTEIVSIYTCLHFVNVARDLIQEQ